MEQFEKFFGNLKFVLTSLTGLDYVLDQILIRIRCVMGRGSIARVVVRNCCVLNLAVCLFHFMEVLEVF